MHKMPLEQWVHYCCYSDLCPDTPTGFTTSQPVFPLSFSFIPPVCVLPSWKPTSMFVTIMFTDCPFLYAWYANIHIFSHSYYDFLADGTVWSCMHVPMLQRSILPLSVVLYWCETWSFTLGEEHKLKVFQNRMLGVNVWTQEGKTNRRMEKTVQWGASEFVLFTKYYYIIKSRNMNEEGKQYYHHYEFPTVSLSVEIVLVIFCWLMYLKFGQAYVTISVTDTNTSLSL